MIQIIPLDTSEAVVRSSLPSALYVASNKKYQEAYKQDWCYEDLSFGLYDDTMNELQAYVCMTAGCNGHGQKELSYYGLPAVYVPLRAEGPALRHVVESSVRKIIDTYAPCTLSYHEVSGPHGLSTVAQCFLQAGVACAVSFENVVDLTQNAQSLWGGIRKSYRPLISKGQRLFTHTIITATQADQCFWDSFKSLHIRVSGRQTRNDLSWQRQLESIELGDAFAIASYIGEQLSGVSYYITNGVSCYYGVGAYDRVLFSTHPVSHASIWIAIQHAKDIGCARFELGKCYFPFQDGEFLEKNKNISMFKKGFGGTIFSVNSLKGNIYVQ